MAVLGLQLLRGRVPLCILAVAAAGGRPAAALDVDVEAFGARADGRSFSGDAINAAIAACSSAGGGTVHARGGGAYVVGGVQLRSHVVLSIAPNTSFLGSRDPAKWTRTHADLTIPPEWSVAPLTAPPLN